MDKKILRNQIRQSLKELSDRQYTQSSIDIKHQLLSEPSIIEGNTIAITISKIPEVDTKEIIESLWDLNKKVVVPKCNPDNRSMHFYAIENFKQLEIVYMDLQEPKTDCTEFVSPEKIDCIIVPGIVFDYKGYRIGYGGGYYDRYLTDFKGIKISLAFDIQIVDHVPSEVFDIPVDLIITETDRIDCMKHRREYSI